MADVRINIGKLTSAEAVKTAIAECDALGREAFLKKYGFGPSRIYPLVHAGAVYDSKAIAGVAYGYQHGTFPSAKNFTGGLLSAARALKKLGFAVEALGHPAGWLERGRVYQRKELRDRYGGQLQAGIWTPTGFDVVFLFTGESGAAYGYRDGWTPAGTYGYTGEGQVGNMQFRGGNRAIRDHRELGKDLLLFRDEGKGKGVRYEGLFECVGWTVGRGPDKAGDDRDVIVFELAPVFSAGEHAPAVPQMRTLGELRKAAYAAAAKSAHQTGPKGSTTRNWYERAEDVRAYVLARAGGLCECCGNPAPFKNRGGVPYLEPHHTTRRADNGLDHPKHVAGICPNCHRQVHFGSDGEALNEKLRSTIQAKEAAAGDFQLAA